MLYPRCFDILRGSWRSNFKVAALKANTISGTRSSRKFTHGQAKIAEYEAGKHEEEYSKRKRFPASRRADLIGAWIDIDPGLHGQFFRHRWHASV